MLTAERIINAFRTGKPVHVGSFSGAELKVILERISQARELK